MRPRTPRRDERRRSGTLATTPVPERISVEELSRRTGVTVRNLRELTTRKLLEPPELEGRKGWYGARHLARVALIGRLQDRGYSLASIGDLLGRWASGAGMDGVLGLEDAIASPAAGPASSLSHDAIVRIFPELASDRRLLAKALAAGIVSQHEGALSASNAEHLELARVLADAGIPLEALLAEFVKLEGDAKRIVARFIAVFEKFVFAPLARQGLPAERLADLSRTVRTVRPAAVRAVTLAVAHAFERGVAPPRARARSSKKKRQRAR